MSVTAVTGVLLATAAIAQADVLNNNVGGSAAVLTVAPGNQVIVAFKLNATSTPGGDIAGCDAGGGNDKATLTVVSDLSTGLTISKGGNGGQAPPFSTDVQNCHKSIKLTFKVGSGTAGNTYHLGVTISGGLSGSLYTSNASFTLRVLAGIASTNLALSPAAPSIVYGTATQTWTATITNASSGAGIGGKTINFNVGGVLLTATTASPSGVATLVAPIGTTFGYDPATYDIDATFNGDTSFASSSAAGTFAILKADQLALSITGPTSGTVGDTLPITTSGGSGTGTTAFGASGSCSLTSAGASTVTITSGSGLCTITGSNPGDNNYNPITATPLSFTPGKLAQTPLSVDTPSAGTFGDVLGITTSGGSGTGALTLSASGSACSIPTSGPNAGMLVISSGTGTCSVTASKAGDAQYLPATSPAHPVTISTASQTVTVTGPATGTYGQSYPITSTPGAGTGAITYSATGTACTVSGDQVTITHGTGTCSLTAHQAADGNYGAADSAPFAVTPDKATATLTVTGTTATYNGSSHAVTVTTSPSGLTGVGVTYDGLAGAPTRAGTYAVVASLDNPDYRAVQVSTSLVISPKPLTGAITAINKEYDGTTAATVTASPLVGVVSGDVVGLSATNGNFSSAAVGLGKTVTADLALTGSGAGDYALTSSTASTTADITRRLVAGTISAADKVYDGNDSATATPLGIDRAVLGDDVHLGVVSATFDGIDVGSHTVTALLALSGAEAANYELSPATATAPAAITPRPLTLTLTADDKTYNGDALATVHPSISGALTGDAVTVSAFGAHFPDKNVGQNRTVTTGLQLDGAQALDYSLPAGPYTASASITPLHLTGSFTANGKVYDGSDAAQVLTTGLATPIPTDDVTLVVSDARFDSKDVGTSKTVTAVTSALDGVDKDNYTLDSVSTATASISPKPVTGSIVADDKTYDGTTAATVAAVNPIPGLISGDSVTLTASNGLFGDKTAGIGKTVTASIALSGPQSGDYALTSSTATDTADIGALHVTGAFTTHDKVYDTTRTAAVDSTSVPGKVSADDVTLGVSGALFDTKLVGSNKPVTATGAWLSGADAGNYFLDGVGTQHAAITPAHVTGSFTADGKVYDGLTAATVHSTSLAGVLGIDDVTLSLGGASFDTRHVGVGKTVTGSGPALLGADALNYTLDSVSTTTASISPKPVTGSITASSKVYDGTTAATVAAVNPIPGLISGDSVTLTASNGAFSSPDAGLNKTVTASLGLIGAQAGDYALTATTATATASIGKAPLTVTASSAAVKKGAPVPVITPSYSGWVNGEGPSVLTAAPTCWTDYTTGSEVGSYGTHCAGLAAANYAPTYVDGTVVVTYLFHGFFQPIDQEAGHGNDSTVRAGTIFNKVKAGSAVPVKFDLSGNQGLSIFASGYPKVAAVSCPTGALVDTLEETSTGTTSGLKYDGTVTPYGQYNYTWKTATGWAGTCQRLEVRFLDGTSQYAFFQFTK